MSHRLHPLTGPEGAFSSEMVPLAESVGHQTDQSLRGLALISVTFPFPEFSP